VITILLLFGCMFLVIGTSMIKKRNIELSMSISRRSMGFWGAVHCLVGVVLVLIGLMFGLSLLLRL